MTGDGSLERQELMLRSFLKTLQAMVEAKQNYYVADSFCPIRERFHSVLDRLVEIDKELFSAIPKRDYDRSHSVNWEPHVAHYDVVKIRDDCQRALHFVESLRPLSEKEKSVEHLMTAELNKLYYELELLNDNYKSALDEKKLAQIHEAASKLEKAFSGSCHGYHSLVYYDQFATPPPSAIFSPEWGLLLQRRGLSYAPLGGTTGNWRQHTSEEVETQVFKGQDLLGVNEFQQLVDHSNLVLIEIFKLRGEVISILEILSNLGGGKSFKRIEDDVKSLAMPTFEDLVHKMAPPLSNMCRDSTAFTQGFKVPPHIAILVQIKLIREPTVLCSSLCAAIEQAINHLRRVQAATTDASGVVLPMSEPQEQAKTSIGPTINITNFTGGVMNAGSMENIKHLTGSISRIQRSHHVLGDKLKVFSESVASSDQLSENERVEVLDRLSEVTAEVCELDENKRKPTYKIGDQIKGITECLKGVSTLKGLWEQVYPLISVHLHL